MKNAVASFFVLVMLSSGLAFFLYQGGYFEPKTKRKPIIRIDELADETILDRPESDQAATEVAPGDKSVENPSGNGSLSPVVVTEESAPVQSAAFNEQLKSCLGVIPSPAAEQGQSALNQSNLFGSMSSLGEVVLQSEDWSEKDVLIEGGKTRRIRLEVNLEEEENLGMQKLKYSEVGPDGQLKDLPLNQDQSVSPDPNLIASLESEGKVIREAKKERAYFPGGEELVYASVNGQVRNIELHRFDRTLKCEGPQCRCSSNQAQFDDEGVRPSTTPTAEKPPVEDKSQFRAKSEFQQSLLPAAGSEVKTPPVRK